jgi:hypothetical protein
MDPELEQDERDQYSIEIGRLEAAVPERLNRIRIYCMNDQQKDR